MSKFVEVVNPDQLNFICVLNSLNLSLAKNPSPAIGRRWSTSCCIYISRPSRGGEKLSAGNLPLSGAHPVTLFSDKVLQGDADRLINSLQLWGQKMPEGKKN